MSKTIVFFGNERLATGVTTEAATLRSLVKAGYKVSAVVSHYSAGQSRNSRSLEIQDAAEENNIPLLLPDKLDEKVIEKLKSYEAEVAVLVAYGKIVPQSVIDIFPKGIINVHPSLLPLHRGPTPIESVILDGSNKTGVSIMQLSKDMDAGPIFGQSEITLNGTETKQALADQLLEVGKTMLLELLPDILEGSLVALPQDDSQATYDNLISKDDGLIDWAKPAQQIENGIRAFQEWPKSRTTLGSQEVIITQAQVTDLTGKPGEIQVRDKQLIIYCGRRALSIERLKPSGKKEMTTPEFLRGYGRALLGG